ncbi:MAG: LarC family nickel insertion protein, partial [Myxococcales bacterium]
RGLTQAAHGTLFLPAPATLECLIGHPTYDGEHPFEFVTPTGAALVGALGAPAPAWPRMTPEATGWGAGTANPAFRPNLLRAVLGAPEVSAEAQGSFVLLETNLDDASGELIAYCIERLLIEGAKDAWATPITMKKGRPAVVLSALAQAPDAGRLTVTMLRESTSLGVRTTAVDRVVRPREMIEVETHYGTIPVKVAGGAFGPPQAKPELDACAARAVELGIPLREVILAATLAAAEVLRARGR